MIIIACLLGIGCVFLFMRSVLVSREIKRLAQEVEQMSSARSNCQMTVEVPDAALMELVAAINQMQQRQQEEVAGYIRQEEGYKQSMADISHDLRTPLTALKGYLKLLRKDGQDSEKKKEYVEIAYEKARTLNRLVTSLFELARLDSDTYQFEWEQVNIRELLEQELISFYPEFEKQQLEPEVYMQETGMQIWADHTAVQRIFNNLIQNALNHGAGDIRMKAYVEGGKLSVEISNAAPNLTTGDLGQLFTRAYTADAARSQSGGGLGLSIVKAFAEQMNGSVDARLDAGRLSIVVEFALEDSAGAKKQD